MGLTKKEFDGRMLLKDKKPLAYNKIIQHPQMILEKKCVALIQMIVRTNCNFKCDHCAVDKFDQHSKGELSHEIIKKIADQADAMNLASICISGGEPLIFKDVEQIINIINPERFVISMDTNGWFLTEEKVKWLVQKGVDRVHLSIDGLEKNHDSFRHKEGSWKRNIQALNYIKKNNLGVIINIVATKSLVESGELVKQLEFIKQFEEHASIIYAKETGLFENHPQEILNSKDLEYIQSLTTKYNCSTHLSPNCGHNFGCLCFKRHLSINNHGSVTPCPWIPIEIGNIYQEDLQTIIQRGLDIKWFSYDNHFSCLSGNCDSEFYQKIIPQIETFDEYPVPHSKINWF